MVAENEHVRHGANDRLTSRCETHVTSSSRSRSSAPEPLREIPFKPSRMIHFLDFSNEKMAAKAPDIARQTDILLGNLEDAVPVDRKEAARAGADRRRRGRRTSATRRSGRA